MNFSAVILAGGKSSRMGRDKVLLDVDGQPLLARQIQLVRDAGACEVFISGRANGDYSAFNCPVLRDRFEDSGPLAGIEAALDAATTPLLLVLAVDMPHMSADLLRQLAIHSIETVGTIPRIGGFIEPLASFYPKDAASLLTTLLSAERRSPTRREPKLAGSETGAPSAKHFAGRCVAAGLAQFVDLPATDAHLFANWNLPADVANISATA